MIKKALAIVLLGGVGFVVGFTFGFRAKEEQQAGAA